MDTRLCRALILSATMICAAGMWAQCGPIVFDKASQATLKQQAANGNAAAQCGLGMLYEGGWGASKDYTEAALWFRRAAEQGVAPAQYELGGLYYRGQGVPLDYAQSSLWWRKAAEQNYALAQYALGALYLRGQGLPQDYAEAYFWLDLAAAGKLIRSDAEAATRARDQAASRLTPADLSRVQERARKWFEDHPTKRQ